MDKITRVERIGIVAAIVLTAIALTIIGTAKSCKQSSKEQLLHDTTAYQNFIDQAIHFQSDTVSHRKRVAKKKKTDKYEDNINPLEHKMDKTKKK